MEFYKSREELVQATDEAEERFKKRHGDKWMDRLNSIVFAIDQMTVQYQMCGRYICCAVIEKFALDAVGRELTEEEQDRIDGYLLAIRRYEGGLCQNETKK